MPRNNIPDWEDMPETVSLVSLSWEDVFMGAWDELQRDPTPQEVIAIFDKMSSSMKWAAEDAFSDQLHRTIPEIVVEYLKSKPYNQDGMTTEQLLHKKYCHECEEIQQTYWELNYCEKNPEGIDNFLGDHRNDGCEDEYCNPKSDPVESDIITTSYIKEHAVFERCVKCHQYFDSEGPQRNPCNNCHRLGWSVKDTDKKIPCNQCNGTGEVNS